MRIPSWLLAWGVTLILEVPCVAALYRGERRKMALVCAVATSATNLPLNLLLPRWIGLGEQTLLIGETAALFLEAGAYLAASRSRGWPRALIASALANAMSFSAGLVLGAFGLL